MTVYRVPFFLRDISDPVVFVKSINLAGVPAFEYFSIEDLLKDRGNCKVFVSVEMAIPDVFAYYVFYRDGAIHYFADRLAENPFGLVIDKMYMLAVETMAIIDGDEPGRGWLIFTLSWNAQLTPEAEKYADTW